MENGNQKSSFTTWTDSRVVNCKPIASKSMTDMKLINNPTDNPNIDQRTTSKPNLEFKPVFMKKFVTLNFRLLCLIGSIRFKTCTESKSFLYLKKFKKSTSYKSAYRNST